MTRLAAIGWMLVGLLFGLWALATVSGPGPRLLLLAVLAAATPILGLVLGVALDRWSGGRPGRLLAAAFLLAAGVSGLLLLAPKRVEGSVASATIRLRDGQPPEEQRTVEHVTEIRWAGLLQTQGPGVIGRLAVPVAIAAVPGAIHWLTRRWGGALRPTTGLTATVAAILLIGVVVLGSMSGVGILYIPSASAMAAAAVRSWLQPKRTPSALI